MGDGACLRPQLPRHHLQDVPEEPRECQPWVCLKSGLGFPKEGVALSQELQNQGWDCPQCVCRVFGEARQLEQMQSEMMAREAWSTRHNRRAGLGEGQGTGFCW